MGLSGRSGQYVFLLGALALKLGVSSRSRQLIRIEAENNQRARQCPMWRDLVVPVTRFGSLLISRRHSSPAPQQENDLEVFIETQIETLKGVNRAAALSLVDLTPVLELRGRGLENDTIASFRELLSSFDLPKTASHGDFFDGNAVYRHGALALIDWDSFREESSFVFDAIHFYINQGQKILNGKSWTLMIFEDALDNLKINRVCDGFGVSCRHGVFSYAIDRLSRELLQEQGASKLASRKAEKYLKMCRNLMSLG